MKYGAFVPNGGDFFDPRLLAELAYEAEESGWDGFFIWDHMLWSLEGRFADPWVALAVIAMRTERIRIGPMVTPMPRRRPWKLARETVSLDHLSNGRLILGVGLGVSPEFEQFGEEEATKVRAQKLDEGLDVLTGLWAGEPFSYRGKHYRLDDVVFTPPPVQSPRIPIWVAGGWPSKGPLRRAARWDGVFPNGGGKTPDDIRAIVAYVKEQRASDAPFEVAFGTRERVEDSAKLEDTIAAYADAGLTWWMQRLGHRYGSFEDSRARIRQGPPRV